MKILKSLVAFGFAILGFSFSAIAIPLTTIPEITLPTTTNVQGCEYNGNWYMPGTDISRGESGSWCYGVYCDESGQIINWDNFDCYLSSPPVTTPEITTPPTTYPPTTILTTREHGCYYEGKFYPPNIEVNLGKDGNWCYGLYCDSEGNLVHWDNFNCFTPTTPSLPPTTTTPSSHHPTTTPTLPPTTHRTTTTAVPEFTTPFGCYYRGRWYRPDSEVSRGQTGRWCYGLHCDTSGNLITWDNWNCGTTNAPITTPTTPPGELTTDGPSVWPRTAKK